MSYLSDISHFSEDNVGSVLKVKVARAVDVLTVPDVVDGVIYGDLTFKEGTGFVEWRLTEDSARLVSEGSPSPEGEIRKNKIEFFVPKDRKSLRTILSRMAVDEFVLLIEDNNGVVKIFGQPWAPARFRYTHDTGSAHVETNRYICEFYYEGPENIFFYEGAVPAAPAGAAPVVIQWADGTFIAQAQPGDIVNVSSDFEHDFEVITS